MASRKNKEPPLPPGFEYAIFDRGEDLKNTQKLYIARTWPTKFEAECERNSLLKHFPPENKWHQRLIIKDYKAIPQGINQDRVKEYLDSGVQAAE